MTKQTGNLCFACLAFGLLLAGLASCGRDDATAPGRTDLPNWTTADKDVPSDYFLNWLYHQNTPEVTDPVYAYEVALSGWVSVQNGGALQGHPASWPDVYKFRYVVLPNTMDTSTAELDSLNFYHDGATGEDWVKITIEVPVLDTAFPCADGEMPFLLSPHGLDYPGGPAYAQLCLHPNLVPNCTSDFVVYYPLPINDVAYTLGGYGIATYEDPVADKLLMPGLDRDDPLGGDPYDAAGCRLGIWALIPHHSKWAIEEDNGSDCETCSLP